MISVLCFCQTVRGGDRQRQQQWRRRRQQGNSLTASSADAAENAGIAGGRPEGIGGGELKKRARGVK